MSAVPCAGGRLDRAVQSAVIWFGVLSQIGTCMGAVDTSKMLCLLVHQPF